MTYAAKIFVAVGLFAATLMLLQEPGAGLLLQEPGAGTENEDVASVRALGAAYTSAWLADDHDGVLDVFAKDAVLVPHLGNPQAVGREAIRKHFWPPGAPPTAIETFTQSSKEVVVAGKLAYDRGTFELSFMMEGSPDPFTSRGNYVAVARKDDQGRWRWVLYTWNHP